MGLLVFVSVMVAFIWLMNPVIQGVVNASVYGFTASGSFGGYQVVRSERVTYVSRPINFLTPWERVTPQAIFWFASTEEQIKALAEEMASRRIVINVRDGYEDMSDADKHRAVVVMSSGRKVWPSEDIAEFMGDSETGWWVGKDEDKKPPIKRTDLKLV